MRAFAGDSTITNDVPPASRGFLAMSLQELALHLHSNVLESEDYTRIAADCQGRVIPENPLHRRIFAQCVARFPFFAEPKVWLAVLTLLAMGAFIFLPVIGQIIGRSGGSTNPVVVTTSKFGNLRLWTCITCIKAGWLSSTCSVDWRRPNWSFGSRPRLGGWRTIATAEGDGYPAGEAEGGPVYRHCYRGGGGQLLAAVELCREP